MKGGMREMETRPVRLESSEEGVVGSFSPTTALMERLSSLFKLAHESYINRSEKNYALQYYPLIVERIFVELSSALTNTERKKYSELCTKFQKGKPNSPLRDQTLWAFHAEILLRSIAATHNLLRWTVENEEEKK